MVAELRERAASAASGRPPAAAAGAGGEVVDDPPELQEAEVDARALLEAHALRAARSRGALRPSQVRQHDL